MTRGQLLDAGVHARAIGRWAETGRLIPVLAGVYAVGHVDRSPFAGSMAAVLACGPEAALSHASAAALWDLGPFPDLPEVTAPSCHRRRGIATHRSTTLTPDLIRRHHGVPVTSVPRTIADIAPRLTDAQLVRLVNDARTKAILGPNQLAELANNHRRIKRLVDPTPGHNPTKSQFEDRFLRLCRRHRLPTPQTNVRILPGHEADIVFPDHRVIVELDSWTHHRSHQSFVSDRARDRRTAAAGFVTLRFTWDAVTAEADKTAAQLRAVLATRRSRSRSR